MRMRKRNKLGLDSSITKVKNGAISEDSTAYGEFISRFDSWITLEDHKRNADYLANIEKINAEEEELERYKE